MAEDRFARTAARVAALQDARAAELAERVRAFVLPARGRACARRRLRRGRARARARAARARGRRRRPGAGAARARARARARERDVRRGRRRAARRSTTRRSTSPGRCGRSTTCRGPSSSLAELDPRDAAGRPCARHRPARARRSARGARRRPVRAGPRRGPHAPASRDRPAPALRGERARAPPRAPRRRAPASSPTTSTSPIARATRARRALELAPHGPEAYTAVLGWYPPGATVGPGSHGRSRIQHTGAPPDSQGSDRSGGRRGRARAALGGAGRRVLGRQRADRVHVRQRHLHGQPGRLRRARRSSPARPIRRGRRTRRRSRSSRRRQASVSPTRTARRRSRSSRARPRRSRASRSAARGSPTRRPVTSTRFSPTRAAPRRGSRLPARLPIRRTRPTARASPSRDSTGGTGYDIWTIRPPDGIRVQVTTGVGRQRAQPVVLARRVDDRLLVGRTSCSGSARTPSSVPQDLGVAGTASRVLARRDEDRIHQRRGPPRRDELVGQRRGCAHRDRRRPARLAVESTSSTGPPRNLSYPTINLSSGDSSPVVGHFLTASVGSWEGAFPISYKYQWKRCDAADPVNGTCVDIAGATSSFYTPVAADAGKRLRVQVTASNSLGATPQNSEVDRGRRRDRAEAARHAADQQRSARSSTRRSRSSEQSGTARRRSRSRTRGAAATRSATSRPASRSPARRSRPTRRRCRTSASRSACGSRRRIRRAPTAAITNHTFPVVDKQHFAPSAATSPTVVGTAGIGRQLTANIGNYSGDAPVKTAFVWQRCDATGAACRVIAGAKKIVVLPDARGRRLHAAHHRHGDERLRQARRAVRSDGGDRRRPAAPEGAGTSSGRSRPTISPGGGYDDVILGHGRQRHDPRRRRRRPPRRRRRQRRHHGRLGSRPPLRRSPAPTRSTRPTASATPSTAAPDATAWSRTRSTRS